ncbi:MAG: dethiobiotin synthase [Thermodesulfovibrionales bacterium]|nr:dethiobiotin synthase [Thermodesulfovibrionales bacterium]
MAKGFFVTGTDTGVGKTVVAAALIKAAGLLGVKACGMKPVETGCTKEGNVMLPSDGMFLKEIAHMDETVSHVTPCCFEHELAPMVSAEIEGTTVDINKIRVAFDKLGRAYQAIVVEGVGGLLVPIIKDYFVLDLAREMGLPLVVVARSWLGTINHTLLTVNYALKEGLEVVGIVINHTYQSEGSMAEKTNPQIIEQLSPVPLIGIFPYLDDVSGEALEKAVLKNLNMEIIRRYL